MNARLISLAPEMAEALKVCADCLDLARSYWHVGRAGRNNAETELEQWNKALHQTRALLARLEGKA